MRIFSQQICEFFLISSWSNVAILAVYLFVKFLVLYLCKTFFYTWCFFTTSEGLFLSYICLHIVMVTFICLVFVVFQVFCYIKYYFYVLKYEEVIFFRYSQKNMIKLRVVTTTAEMSRMSRMNVRMLSATMCTPQQTVAIKNSKGLIRKLFIRSKCQFSSKCFLYV